MKRWRTACALVLAMILASACAEGNLSAEYRTSLGQATSESWGEVEQGIWDPEAPALDSKAQETEVPEVPALDTEQIEPSDPTAPDQEFGEPSPEEGAPVEPSPEEGTQGDLLPEAADPSEAEEPAPSEAPEPQDISIWIELRARGELYLGDRVTLVARVEGVCGDYELRWEVDSGDGLGWRPIPGARGPEYELTLTPESARCDYRVVLTTS